jgi:serine/threonine protein kinase
MGQLAKTGLDLDIDIIRMYMAQLFTALEFIHSEGYLIRNLGPDSILVDKKSNICIADLSMAKPIQQVENHNVENFPKKYHMAPEVARGETCNEKADYYSLGALGHFLVSNTLPSHCKRPLVKLDTEFAFELLLEKLLEPKSEKRPCDVNIKIHGFFRRINWCDILEKQFNTAMDFINEDFFCETSHVFDFFEEADHENVNIEEQKNFF